MSPIYRILGLCLLAQYLTSCHAIQPVATPSVSPPISSSMLPANVTAGGFNAKNSTLEELDRKVQNGISRWEEPYFANAKNSTSLFQKIGSLTNKENLEQWTKPLLNFYKHLFGADNPDLLRDQLNQALHEAVQREGTGNQGVNEAISLLAAGASMNKVDKSGFSSLSRVVGKAMRKTGWERYMRIAKKMLTSSDEKPDIDVGKVYIEGYVEGYNETYTSIRDFLGDMCNAQDYLENKFYGSPFNPRMECVTLFYASGRISRIREIGKLLNFSTFELKKPCPRNDEKHARSMTGSLKYRKGACTENTK